MPGAAILAQRPWLDRIVVVTAALVPILSLLAPLGLAPLLLAVAVLAMAVGPRDLIVSGIPRGPALLLAIFLVWGLISAAWAIEPSVALYKGGQLFFLFAAGLILLGVTRTVRLETRATAAAALAGSIVIVLGLFLVESIFGAPISRLLHPHGDLDPQWLIGRHNRAATVITMLLVPAAFVAARRYSWRAGAVLALAGIVILALLHSRTSIVAIVAAVAVSVIALRWRAVAQGMVAVALAASLFLVPLLPAALLSDKIQATVMREEAISYNVLSFFHRLRIWEFVVQKIDERPVLGWGLDSSRALPGGKEPSDAAGEKLSLHPHNAPLQVRVELGLPGFLLAAALVLWPVVRLRRYSDEAAPVILAVSLAAAIVASMSYGIWQSWWISALWLTVALTSLSCPPPSSAT